MSVFRINKTKDYTTMSNYHLKDKNISLKAKGLLSVMLSLPDDWKYSIEGLITILKESETSVISTLKELKDYNYLNVIKLMPNETKSGRIEYIYDVFETPYQSAKQEGEKQDLENLGLENQDLENVGLLNTNNKNTNDKVLKDKEKYKREKLNLVYDQQEEINEVEEWFDYFWKCYPKKVDKKGSYKAFKNIPHLNKELFHTIYTSLELHKRSAQWQNPQYIPNPTTWLHQARWETSIDVKSNKTTQWYDNYQQELEQKQQSKPKVDVENLDDLSCFFNKK